MRALETKKEKQRIGPFLFFLFVSKILQYQIEQYDIADTQTFLPSTMAISYDLT